VKAYTLFIHVERKRAMRYQLSGKLTIWQHCYDDPHPVAGKPSICEAPASCGGHFITQSLTEVVRATSEEDAIDNSMSVYEGGDLEPTWCEGYPKIKQIKGTRLCGGCGEPLTKDEEEDGFCKDCLTNPKKPPGY
jgi:hypothetical protein